MNARLVSVLLAASGSAALAWLAWRRWWLPWDRHDLGLLMGLGCLALGWLFVLAGWAWRLDRDAVGPGRVAAALAALACFALGAELSAVRAFSLQAMLWYSAGTLGFAWAALRPDRGRGLGAPALPWPRLGGLAALMALLAWGIPRAQRAFRALYYTTDDRYSAKLMFMDRHGGGAIDIPGTDFEPLTGLWLLPVLLGLLALLLAWGRLPRFRPWAPWAAAAWGWLSKLCLAGLSSLGLGILGVKIRSINTAYYTLTEKADAMGWWAFIHGYSKLQGSLGPHGETHSFLPIVIYKLLRLLSFDSPTAVAVMLAGINALIAVPVWRLAARHLRHPAAGLAAALLVLSSPLSLLLATAGIDGMVALMAALSLERLDAALRGGGPRVLAQAALAAFAGSLLSYGFPVLNLFFFPWAWWVLARQRGGWLASALPAAGWLAVYSAAFVGLHVLLYALSGGGFNVLKGLDTAGHTHLAVNRFRLYEIWAWGNIVLFAGYLGVGLLGAWLWRLAEGLWLGDHDDAWLLLTLPLAATLILSAMGRGEVQRMFMYMMAFLAPAAAGALLFRRGPRGALHLPGLWLLAALNVGCAAVLQAHVLDYW